MLKIFVILCLTGLIACAIENASLSRITPHGNLTWKQTSTETNNVYISVIEPFLKDEFKKDISDEFLVIKRHLLFGKLYRHEVIEGQNRYNVHIEFAVSVRDRFGGTKIASVKGQEIIFLIEDGKIKNYFSFSEYVILIGKITQEYEV